MSKSIFKYLSVLSIIVLCGISMLYANSIESHNNACSIQQIEISNNASFKPLQQNDDKNIIFEVAEIQEIESEESVSKTNTYGLHGFFAKLYSISFFKEVPSQSNKDLYYYKNYHDKSSTKLHVRLQVFII